MVRPLKYKTEEERTAYLETRKQDRHKPRVQLGDRHKPRVRPGDRHKEGYQSPTRLEKFSHSEFVAWDGEGFDIQKPDDTTTQPR